MINSNIKESIKTSLSLGIRLSFIGNIDAYKLNNHYIVSNVKFFDLDEAVNYFISRSFSSKNRVYIQNRLVERGILTIEELEYYIDSDSDYLDDLMLKESDLVDKEYKLLNINEVLFPSFVDGYNEMEEIVKDLTIDNIGEKLLMFDKKYSVLNPYLSISLCYDNNNSDWDYRIIKKYDDISFESLDSFKESFKMNGNVYTWKYVKLSLRLDGGEVKFYILSI